MKSHTPKYIYIYIYIYIYVCIGYITRWRSLCDLHTEGRRPQGCVNHVETEPSDITDLYHGALP